MQRLLNEKGSDDLLMTMGLGVVGAVYTNKSDATVDKAVPIARLIEEQEAILVPKDSPFKTVDDFVEAWKADPDKVVVGGGSAPGGPDFLFPMQLADAVGVTPKDVAYVEYDGGGPLTTALLGSKIDVGMSGLGEFEGQIADGSLRVLAVSGEERLGGGPGLGRSVDVAEEGASTDHGGRRPELRAGIVLGLGGRTAVTG